MTKLATAELRTRTGFIVHVRAAEASDDLALARFFEHVSKDDLRFRFLSAVQTVSDTQIAAMTHVDHRQTEDFMVFDGKRVIANAMLAADKKMETAEVAISIDADYKDRGIESALLDYLAQVAKARGIKKLQAIENRENLSLIELEKKAGYKARGIEGDPMLVMLETTL